ncbi:MAG: hydrogenase iron-sulfur subunit [Desulfobacterales bacterium]|nr:hydrogenase iron-sulfur subunit [Desulfobacterales bacterium]
MSNFEPEIVAFCCHYCAYTAADMAGTRRISYPSNVKIIRVPCTGKVDAIHLMKALEKGADGVYVAGCLVGDCHFKDGNLRAEAHVDKIKKTLEDLGWESERVGMMHFSAGMGEGFAEAATEFTEKIKALGPSPASQATSKAV